MPKIGPLLTVVKRSSPGLWVKGGQGKIFAQRRFAASPRSADFRKCCGGETGRHGSCGAASATGTPAARPIEFAGAERAVRYLHAATGRSNQTRPRRVHSAPCVSKTAGGRVALRKLNGRSAPGFREGEKSNAAGTKKPTWGSRSFCRLATDLGRFVRAELIRYFQLYSSSESPVNDLLFNTSRWSASAACTVF